MTDSPSGDELLLRRVVEMLREGLAERYQRDNLRRYRGFDGFSDGSLDSLREFGLRHIYPDWERRCFQIRVFEKTTSLLGNPQRMSPLVAIGLKSLWRFGSQLPKAVNAGRQVIGAFEVTRQLESRLIGFIGELGLRDSILADRGSGLSAALAAMPRREFEGYVRNMADLMRLLAQRTLLDTGAAVLRDIAAAMDRRSDIYDEDEREGARYAVEVMSEGMGLFESLDPEWVAAAIEAVPMVELDWFAESTQEQAGRPEKKRFQGEQGG